MFKLLVLAQTQTGDFSSKDIPGLLLAIVVAGALIFLGSGGLRRPQRQRRADGAEDEERGAPPAAVPAQPAAPAQAPAKPSPPADDEVAFDPPPHPATVKSTDRLHTAIVGGSGDTKTQAQIALFVGDIARGDQVVWASTNGALYNFESQQTDLRPIADYFEMVHDEEEIVALIRWGWEEVKRRRELARQNKATGHRIAFHFDEWPELANYCKENHPKVLRTFARLLEQGRKFGVTVDVSTHNFLADTLGLSGGERDLFQTRLVANTDADSWFALMGKGVPHRRVPKKSGQFWMPALGSPNGAVRIQMQIVTVAQIMHITRRPPPPFQLIRPQLQAFMSSTDDDGEDGDAAQTPGRKVDKPKGVVITQQHLQLKAMVEEARPRIAELMQQPRMTLAQARKTTETSDRALARRLGRGDNGGNASVKVGEMLKDIETVFNVRLYDGEVDGEGEAVGEQEGAAAPAPPIPSEPQLANAA